MRCRAHLQAGAHAAVAGPAEEGGKGGAVGALRERGGQRGRAQLRDAVREEADRAIALRPVLAQLRAVPARGMRCLFRRA